MRKLATKKELKARRDGNKVIGDFLKKKFKDPLNYMYDLDWAKLIPAWSKFMKKYIMSDVYSTDLSNCCKRFHDATDKNNIKLAFDAFVDAIKEFYKIKDDD